MITMRREEHSSREQTLNMYMYTLLGLEMEKFNKKKKG